MTPRGLQALLGRLGFQKPWQAAVVAAISVGALWGVVTWATAPDWVPAMSQVPLESVDAVMQALDERDVPNKLSRGGRDVLVPSKDRATAMVALSAAGLRSEGQPGFELFDEQSWGMTDFSQRINYRRALEGELGRTISGMRGVGDARVHLTMHETSPFKNASRPAEASVVLTLAGGPPGKDVLRGIAMLVAGSVDQLDSDRVSIVDDTGRILSAAIEPGSTAGASSRQLEMRQDLERYLESRAETLVSEVVGAGNARVRVAALINFDQIERRTESLDPDGQVVTSETTEDVTPEDPSLGAAGSKSTVEFDTPRTVENFIGGAGRLDRLTVSVLLNDPLDANGAPVARPAQDVARIETLVSNAVGLDATRGDAITVVSTPFEAPPPVPVANGIGIMDRIQTLYRPIVALIGFILMFLIALRTLKLVSESKAEVRALTPVTPEGVLASAQERAGEIAGDALMEAGDARYLDEDSRERAARVARDRPEAAARQLRAWMQES